MVHNKKEKKRKKSSATQRVDFQTRTPPLPTRFCFSFFFTACLLLKTYRPEQRMSLLIQQSIRDAEAQLQSLKDALSVKLNEEKKKADEEARTREGLLSRLQIQYPYIKFAGVTQKGFRLESVVIRVLLTSITGGHRFGDDFAIQTNTYTQHRTNFNEVPFEEISKLVSEDEDVTSFPTSKLLSYISNITTIENCNITTIENCTEERMV